MPKSTGAFRRPAGEEESLVGTAEDFLEGIRLLHTYWRIVEFPPDEEV